MCRTLFTLPLVLCLLAAADPDPEPSDATKSDLKAMQGTWQMVKAMRNGKVREKNYDDVTMEVTKDKLIIKEKNREEPAGFTINAKKNPREIDIAPPKGEKKVLGIYKLTKDELTITFHQSGTTRPTKFDDMMASVLMFNRKK